MWQLPPAKRVLFRVLRLKQRDERRHQRLRLGGMIAAKVAHVHIQRDCLLLRPGVQAHMRLCQQHGGGESAGRCARHGKGVKQLGHGLQTRVLNRLHAPRASASRLGEPVRIALAAMKIGGEVKSLHGMTVSQFAAQGLATSPAKRGVLPHNAPC